MLQGKRFVKLLKYTFCFNMITYPSEENLTYQILTLKTGKTQNENKKYISKSGLDGTDVIVCLRVQLRLRDLTAAFVGIEPESRLQI